MKSRVNKYPFLIVIAFIASLLLILPILSYNDKDAWQYIILFLFIFLGSFLPFFLHVGKYYKWVNILFFVWFLRVFVAFFFLYQGWIPDLFSQNERWGHDPQRYYFYSIDLLNSNWDIGVLEPTHYGVMIYYALIFAILGKDPLFVAVCNFSLSWLALLFAFKYFSKITTVLNKNPILSAFIFFLCPEILWNDIMPGRDSILLSYTLLSIISFLEYLSNTSSVNSKFYLCISLLFALLIVGLRPVMIVPMISFFFFTKFNMNYTNLSKIKYLFLFGIAIAFVLPTIAKNILPQLTGQGFELFSVLSSRTSISENNVAAGESWSNSSFGALLIPNNFVESIAFIFPRFILYMLAPLPNFKLDIDGIFIHNWTSWNHIIYLSTSTVHLILFPLVIKSVLFVIKNRRHDSIKKISNLVIVFILFVLTISGGNFIIHERYRLVVLPFFYFIALLSYKDFPTLVSSEIFKRWIIFLVICFTLYLFFNLSQ
jgi:hypothetical protein